MNSTCNKNNFSIDKFDMFNYIIVFTIYLTKNHTIDLIVLNAITKKELSKYKLLIL